MFEFLKPGYFDRSYYSFKAHYGLQRKVDMWQGPVQRSVTMPLKAEEIIEIRNAVSLKDIESVCAKYNISERDVSILLSTLTAMCLINISVSLKNLYRRMLSLCLKMSAWTLSQRYINDVLYPMADEQLRLYTELEEQYITEFEGQEVSVLNKLTLYTRLSQIAGGFIPYEDDETGERTPVSNWQESKSRGSYRRAHAL